MIPASVVPVPSANGSRVASHGGLIDINIRLTGVTPHLANAMSEAQLLAMRDKVKAPKNSAKPSLKDEAESKLHTLPDGRPHIPVMMMMSCLIAAGQFIRLDGKRQISTAEKTVLPGMLSILNAQLPLTKPGTDESATWEIDIQQGRNPNGGEAVCIVRPRFDAWELNLSVQVDQAQMSVNLARELIDIAGLRCGLGDFRPQRRGIFGRFKVTAWEQVAPINP